MQMEEKITYQEKKHIASLIGSILIFGGYCLYIYDNIQTNQLAVSDDLYFWAKAFLIMIPVSIVGRILIMIIFAIMNHIITRREEKDLTDERDKLIELKAIRNTHWIFILGFFIAMGSILMGMSMATMFIIIAFSGFISDVAGELSHIWMYRKGI